jgi:hypothetical protein
MFDIFKSKWTRAVESTAHFIPKMLEPYGKNGMIPAAALRDPYCVGFLQIVGLHVASPALGKGSGREKAMAVFEEALKQFAPNHAREAIDLLSVVCAKTNPQNEAFLRGRQDGDLYMGWKLLHLAPQSHGEAALERFFDRMRYLDSPPPTPSPKTRRSAPPTQPPKAELPPPRPSGGKVRVDWGDWTIIGNDLVRQYDFQNLPFAPKLMLQIRITVEMGSFGFLHCHPHFIMQPPISQEREITRTIVCDTEDGTVEVGPMQVTVAHVSGDASMFWFFGENSKKLLKVLYSMKRIPFILLEPDSTVVQMVLPLETGPNYREVFSRIQDQVTAAAR